MPKTTYPATHTSCPKSSSLSLSLVLSVSLFLSHTHIHNHAFSDPPPSPSRLLTRSFGSLLFCALRANLCRTSSPSGAPPWAVKQTNKQTDRANTLPAWLEFHSYKGSYRARLVSCGWISLAYLAHSAQFQAESYCGPFRVRADRLCKRQQLSGSFCGGVEFTPFR